MDRTQLGAAGPDVSVLGLGAMGMSDLYGPADHDEGLLTIRASLDAGINLIDTGDFYGLGANEMLIARALDGVNREDVVLSVKFGAQRSPDGSWLGHDNSPNAVKNSLAYSLKRLNVDYIDIYRPARLDPSVPIEETVGAIAEMVHAGYVRHIGLSEVGVETIRRAHAVHPICDLQIEYSLLSRDIEEDVLPATRELGIDITAYGVLARGLLSGHWNANRQLAANDYRAIIDRFSQDNVEKNLALVAALTEIGQSVGATPAQVAIAWATAQGPDIVPVIGARRRDRLSEAVAAASLKLSPSDLERIEHAVPMGAAAGARDVAQSLDPALHGS